MGNRLLSVALALLLSVPVLGDGLIAPSTGAVSVQGANDNADCGGIKGTSGLLQDWTNTVTSFAIASFDGRNGAQWHGEEFPLCTSTLKSENVILTHKYVKDSDSQASITVNLSTTTDDKGSASQMNAVDPQWWWSPTAIVTDTRPRVVITKTDDSTSEPGWATPTDEYEQYDAHSVGTNVPAGNHPPGHPNAGQPITSVNAAHGVASVGGEGADPSDATSFANSTSEFSTSGVAFVTITYTTTTAAASSSDNAKVANWKKWAARFRGSPDSGRRG